MNKILLTVASLMFLSINLYAQQNPVVQQEPIETNRYTYNEDKTINTKTTIRPDHKNNTIEEIVTEYKYSNQNIYSEKVTVKIFNPNKEFLQITERYTEYSVMKQNETNPEIAKRNPCNYEIGKVLQQNIKTSSLVAGELKVIYQVEETMCTKKKIVTENEYDQMGKLFKTTVRNFTAGELDVCYVTKYVEKGSKDTDKIETETAYRYEYDYYGFLIVTVSVSVKKGEVAAERVYEFMNNEFSRHEITKKKGPWLNTDEKTEVALIIKLMKQD